MQRQELLRQLDKDVESLMGDVELLKVAISDVLCRLRKFKEEEKQKIPKWAKFIANGCPSNRLTIGKWYQIKKYNYTGLAPIFDVKADDGDDYHVGIFNRWELCYSDNPPEEEKFIKPNGLPTGDFYISVDDGWVEYRYRITLGSHWAIDSIMRKVYESLGAKYNSNDGVIRTK